MNVVRQIVIAAALLVSALSSSAETGVSECWRPQIEAHVREQFAIYGPQSERHEYFGFIYLHDGLIGSAVVRSGSCSGAKCVVDSAKALQRVPKSATVLGEWHTHPHGGSPSLSKEDVRGAYNNRHMSCYFAFYSTHAGAIYGWNPKQSSVPVAMASRAPLGNYNDPGSETASRVAAVMPGR